MPRNSSSVLHFVLLTVDFLCPDFEDGLRAKPALGFLCFSWTPALNSIAPIHFTVDLEHSFLNQEAVSNGLTAFWLMTLTEENNSP